MFTEWKVTRVAFDAVSTLLGLQLRGDGAAGDDAGAIPEDDAQFLGQLGVAVRPIVTATLEALGYQDGDEVRVVKLWDKERSPTDLEPGETRLFSVGNVARVVRLLAGRVVVEAPEIRLGANAAKKVNREGDGILPGTLTVACTTSTLTLTYDPGTPGATPTVVSIGLSPPAAFVALPAPVVITLGGSTGPGSNKVRAED